MDIKAMVAVRGGSKRVLNKNLRPFAGSTLLELKIRQLKRIPELNGIVVNSEDDGMLALAASLGVETVKRDAAFASDQAIMSDVYQNMAENFNGDVVVYANVTNPILHDATISACIAKYFEQLKIRDSLNTAHAIKEFLFLDGIPMNYELKKQPRSQDLPNILALNFAISIISREKMIKCRNVVGNAPFIYEIDQYEAVDIDNEIDFEIAEYLYQKIRQ